MRFHARFIGRFALTDDQGRNLLPTTRKTRALIARLLLGGEDPIPRSALIELFWGDRDIEQGRASLRQALYEARGLSSDPALLNVSKTALRTDSARLESDLRQLITAAQENNLTAVSDALERWLPLLADCDGLSPRFDAWLTAERRIQTDVVCAELEAAAVRALDRGRAEDCGDLIAFLKIWKPSSNVIDDHRLNIDKSERPSPSPKQTWRRRVRTAGVLGCLIALIVIAVSRWTSFDGHRVIAVEPLDALATDPPAQAVRSEMSGDLVRALASNPGRMQIDQPDGTGSDPRNAAFVISGNAASIGDHLQAHLQLRARDGTVLWSNNFVGDRSDPAGLGEQIATKADAVINCALSTRHTGGAAISDEASRLYLDGCDLVEQYRLAEALQPFREVTRLAPSFARAWADLAVTEVLTAGDLEPADQAAAYRQVVADATHALALDPGTGLAYYALAHTMPGIGNWQRRVAVIARGLQVEPDGSELNNAMGAELLRVGRWREAIAYYRKSMAFDPLNPVKTATLIAPLAFDDQLDEADALIEQASKTWPGNPLIWGAAFRVQIKLDPRRASLMLDDPHRPEQRGSDEVAEDRLWLRAKVARTEANIAAAMSSDLAQVSSDRGTDDLPIVLKLAELGHVEAAYQLAEESKGATNEEYDSLLFRNYLRHFRSDPRFMVLAAHRGLVQIWRATRRWPDFCVDRDVSYDCQAIARAL